MASDDVQRRRWNEALGAYQIASGRYENALMNNDPAERDAAARNLCDAGDVLGRAGQSWVDAQTLLFEAILRDPTSQMDPDGAVLKSILEYRDAKPASATFQPPRAATEASS